MRFVCPKLGCLCHGGSWTEWSLWIVSTQDGTQRLRKNAVCLKSVTHLMKRVTHLPRRVADEAEAAGGRNRQPVEEGGAPEAVMHAPGMRFLEEKCGDSQKNR